MAEKNVWFITGASRGMGIDIAQAALAAGHYVVATARDAAKATAALGGHENHLSVALDVIDEAAAKSAVRAALDRFGRIDVLVNNAGNFHAGYFEGLSATQFRAQMETNFFGPLNVTRAVLPVMRDQRSGQVITITSTAGIVGGEFTSAYAASKFALEGWMDSIRPELELFGIDTMAVVPGFFRTELLVEGSSTILPEVQIEDYAERTAQTIAGFAGMNGQQAGNPKRLGQGLVTLSDAGKLPAHFIAGTDAMEAAGQKFESVQADIQAHRELSASLAFAS